MIREGDTVWVLAAQPWAQRLVQETLFFLPGTWFSIRSVEELERFERLRDFDPALVLSLHWHWRLPAEFVARYRCIGFHASDLPHFRGGAPIENQRARGITETKLTAFRLDAGIDTGPILSQQPLSLNGSKDEIMERISGLVARMLPKILAGACVETPQRGDGSHYSRRDAEGYVWQSS